MSLIQNKSLMMLFCIAGIALLFGCDKDKTPSTETPEPTKWEQIAGHYKVYDTTGVFLYEMDLTHKIGINIYGVKVDSLVFENFDNDFNFSTYQSFFSNWPEMLIRIDAPNPIIDKDGNSWQLFEYWPNELDNEFKNDTIRLHFKKNNTAYWITDAIPYYYCECKQIAVKQH